MSVIDVISNPTYQAIIAAIGSVGASLVIGYGVGRHLTRNEWERRLAQERQRQQGLLAEYAGKEKAKIHFRIKIQMIEDR